MRNEPKIFVRENGQTVEITRGEWDARYPKREPVMCQRDEDGETHTIYKANITHNLSRMALAAGIYEHLWRPGENGIDKAGRLIEPLSNGLAGMKAEPDRFRALDPPNGWGSYAVFVPWIERYLEACRRNPEASVCVSG
jgi:hypothetical protein